MNPTIHIIAAPSGANWELGALPPPAGNVLLLRWQVDGPRDDAGMPAVVARLFADALVAVASVTFPTGDPVTQPGDDVRRVRLAGPVARLGAAFSRRPASFVLRTTRDPLRVRSLFDDADYPWWMGHQAAILSDPAAPPPRLDAASIAALFEDDWAAQVASCHDDAVRGAIRAGVDGDVMGLFTTDASFRTALLDAIRRAAANTGFMVTGEPLPL